MARKNRALVLLVFALASGVLAALLALRYLRQQSRPLAVAEAPRSQIVVAARALPVGAVIAEQDVKTMGWPGAIPAGYITRPADVIGRGLLSPIEPNEAIMAGKLAAQGAGGGEQRQQMSPAERQAAQRAMMFEGITLTDAQKAKLDTIDANMQKAQQEMRAAAGDNPDRAVMMAKSTEIRTKRNDEIKKLLTAEQVKLFEANLAKMPQGGGRRGGR